VAKPYTTHFKDRVNAVSGDAPSYLLTITHPSLGAPVRLCNDTQDIVSNGNTFLSCAFRISLPDDTEGQLPRATIAIDNVGRELTQWLDASNGGRGAQIQIQQVMRDTPNVIEFDITCDLLNTRQTALEISGELGFQNTLALAGLPIMYRPDNTPGLF
jgi:hypothetical protein